ncbi:hypothetical protein IMY05_C4548000100 [Salix suchowensis]|nr:hypothetical protein IMY05_C4548000100 [Salix suchowensis]
MLCRFPSGFTGRSGMMGNSSHRRAMVGHIALALHQILNELASLKEDPCGFVFDPEFKTLRSLEGVADTYLLKSTWGVLMFRARKAHERITNELRNSPRTNIFQLLQREDYLKGIPLSVKEPVHRWLQDLPEPVLLSHHTIIVQISLPDVGTSSPPLHHYSSSCTSPLRFCTLVLNVGVRPGFGAVEDSQGVRLVSVALAVQPPTRPPFNTKILGAIEASARIITQPPHFPEGADWTTPAPLLPLIYPNMETIPPLHAHQSRSDETIVAGDNTSRRGGYNGGAGGNGGNPGGNGGNGGGSGGFGRGPGGNRGSGGPPPLGDLLTLLSRLVETPSPPPVPMTLMEAAALRPSTTRG